MEANIGWLDDPQVFRVNQLPAHSDHRTYRSGAEAKNGRSSYVQSLDGDWFFHFANEPQKRPRDFYKRDFDSRSFDIIKVPGHIELAGYGQIQYINTLFPWEGKTFRRPAYALDPDHREQGAFSAAKDNTVGSYIKSFSLEPGLRNKRIIIQFQGVERAMYVWLNGYFVGYAEDSFTPTEFDLTPYLNDENNILAVEVFKLSTASFLEDQDMFRFSGIFRSVHLIAEPAIHLADLAVYR